MNTNIVKAVLVSTVIGFAMPAMASSEAVKTSVHEVSSGNGREAVELRVKAAAKRVCSKGGVDERNLHEMRVYKQCVAEAREKANVQIAALQASTQLASRAD